MSFNFFKPGDKVTFVDESGFGQSWSKKGMTGVVVGGVNPQLEGNVIVDCDLDGTCTRGEFLPERFKLTPAPPVFTVPNMTIEVGGTFPPLPPPVTKEIPMDMRLPSKFGVQVQTEEEFNRLWDLLVPHFDASPVNRQFTGVGAWVKKNPTGTIWCSGKRHNDYTNYLSVDEFLEANPAIKPYVRKPKLEDARRLLAVVAMAEDKQAAIKIAEKRLAELWEQLAPITEEVTTLKTLLGIEE